MSFFKEQILGFEPENKVNNNRDQKFENIGVEHKNNYCSFCGNELFADSNFCSSCGQKVPNSGKNIITKKSYSVENNEKYSILNDRGQNSDGKIPASRGKRLGNFILDAIITYFLSYLFLSPIIINFILTETVIQLGPYIIGFGLWLIGILFSIGYFVLFEGIWSITPAKLITKTKVVMRDGSKPSIGKIIIRSVCRLIPLEAFSFLFDSNPVGWHDSLSDTLVVPTSYSERDVRGIKVEKTSNKVLIMIIISVSILVISLLSTWAVVALNNARMKSRDAKRVSDIKQIQTALELYYNDIGKYPEKIFSGQKIEYGTEVYMSYVPSNPKPNDGTCPLNFEYQYNVSQDLSNYEIIFCLGSETGEIKGGINAVSRYKPKLDDTADIKNNNNIDYNEICQKNYGPYAYYTNTKNEQGNIICDCSLGYKWNDKQDSCVRNNAIRQPMFNNSN